MQRHGRRDESLIRSNRYLQQWCCPNGQQWLNYRQLHLSTPFQLTVVFNIKHLEAFDRTAAVTTLLQSSMTVLRGQKEQIE